MNILINLLLLGTRKYTEIDTSRIINVTIKYLLTSEELNDPLLYFTKHFGFDYING